MVYGSTFRWVLKFMDFFFQFFMGFPHLFGTSSDVSLGAVGCQVPEIYTTLLDAQWHLGCLVPKNPARTVADVWR